MRLGGGNMVLCILYATELFDLHCGKQLLTTLPLISSSLCAGLLWRSQQRTRNQSHVFFLASSGNGKRIHFQHISGQVWGTTATPVQIYDPKSDVQPLVGFLTSRGFLPQMWMLLLSFWIVPLSPSAMSPIVIFLFWQISRGSLTDWTEPTHQQIRFDINCTF